MHFTNIIFSLYALSDVYNLLSYGRVKTYIDSNKKNNIPHLTTVSGDFLSPYKYTNIDGGKTITKIFDLIGIDVVSLGNHEFDINLSKLNESLDSNVGTTFVSTNIKYISNTVPYYIYNVSAIMFGFVGLCGENFFHKYQIEFENDDFITNTLNSIKHTYNLDYIIGLTHGDLEQDYLWIDKFPQLDIILGGHIHHHDYSEYKSVPIIRTGENADSLYTIDFYSNKSFQINMIDITNLIPDQSVVDFNQKAEENFDSFNKMSLFKLDAQYSSINPRNVPETLPKLFCYLITNYFDSQITILNAGIFRKNKIFDGELTYGDLQTILPYQDIVIVIPMKLSDLVEGIEYSNLKHKGKGGYIQSDIDIVEIKKKFNYNKLNINIMVNVSTVQMLLRGIDPNPYWVKYSNSFGEKDGIPIHNILFSYQGMRF